MTRWLRPMTERPGFVLAAVAAFTLFCLLGLGDPRSLLDRLIDPSATGMLPSGGQERELYEKGGDRVKTLSVDPDSVSREGKSWVPRSVAIKDLKNESETKLLVSKVKLDADLPDRLFSVTALERGN